MTTTTTDNDWPRVHDRNEETGCDGVGYWICRSCRADLCPCCFSYGHDCEDEA